MTKSRPRSTRSSAGGGGVTKMLAVLTGVVLTGHQNTLNCTLKNCNVNYTSVKLIKKKKKNSGLTLVFTAAEPPNSPLHLPFLACASSASRPSPPGSTLHQCLAFLSKSGSTTSNFWDPHSPHPKIPMLVPLAMPFLSTGAQA